MTGKPDAVKEKKKMKFLKYIMLKEINIAIVHAGNFKCVLLLARNLKPIHHIYGNSYKVICWYNNIVY